MIDKAPAFSRLGYILSLKSFGIDIVRSLGLLEELRRYAIPYRALRIHDSRGALVQEYPEEIWEGASKGALFLLRSDLHFVLHSAASRSAPVHFGTHLTRVESVHRAGSTGPGAQRAPGC